MQASSSDSGTMGAGATMRDSMRRMDSRVNAPGGTGSGSVGSEHHVLLNFLAIIDPLQFRTIFMV